MECDRGPDKDPAKLLELKVGLSAVQPLTHRKANVFFEPLLQSCLAGVY
jgi:hypothetical protein